MSSKIIGLLFSILLVLFSVPAFAVHIASFMGCYHLKSMDSADSMDLCITNLSDRVVTVGLFPNKKSPSVKWGLLTGMTADREAVFEFDRELEITLIFEKIVDSRNGRIYYADAEYSFLTASPRNQNRLMRKMNKLLSEKKRGF